MMLDRQVDIPKILIADDDEVLLQALPETLRLRFGAVDVHTASSAQRALEVVKGQSFDVVVTDLIMPGMSGLALMEEVLKICPTLAMVLITAHPNPEGSKVGRRFAFIKKPIDRDDLARTVRHAVRVGRFRRRIMERRQRSARRAGANGRALKISHAAIDAARKRLRALRTSLAPLAIPGL